MDPATAFQIACGAIQLVGVGIKITRTFKELAKSGSTLANQCIQADTQKLTDQILRTENDLKTARSLRGLSAEDCALQKAVADCLEASGELRDMLDTLSTKNSKTLGRTMRITFRIMRYKSKVEEAQVKLEKRYQKIDSARIASLWQRSNVSCSQLHRIKERVDLHLLQEASSRKLINHNFDEILQSLEFFRLQSSQDAQDKRKLISEKHDETANHKQLDQLIEHLTFPSINKREEGIQEAHSTTFHWIFDTGREAHRPWDNFGLWLEEEAGVYWINGKPGSGKSTGSYSFS